MLRRDEVESIIEILVNDDCQTENMLQLLQDHIDDIFSIVAKRRANLPEDDEFKWYHEKHTGNIIKAAGNVHLSIIEFTRNPESGVPGLKNSIAPLYAALHEADKFDKKVESYNSREKSRISGKKGGTESNKESEIICQAIIECATKYPRKIGILNFLGKHTSTNPLKIQAEDDFPECFVYVDGDHLYDNKGKKISISYLKKAKIKKILEDL